MERSVKSRITAATRKKRPAIIHQTSHQRKQIHMIVCENKSTMLDIRTGFDLIIPKLQDSSIVLTALREHVIEREAVAEKVTETTNILYSMLYEQRLH